MNLGDDEEEKEESEKKAMESATGESEKVLLLQKITFMCCVV